MRAKSHLTHHPRLFLITLFLFFPFHASAQTPTPAPLAYRFKADTVWAKVYCTVIDYRDHFQIECESDSPMEGWVLDDNQTEKNVSSNQDITGRTFKIEVARRFTDYILTVFVEGDNDKQIPLLLELQPSKETLSQITVYKAFEVNPTRPYNGLVKSLYDQAGHAYDLGDTKSALDYLTKAQQIDPSETQVLGFIAKLSPKMEENPTQRFVADCLKKAQKAEADKNSAEAKKQYLEILKMDAKNQNALEGIDRLQAALREEAAKAIEKNIKDGDLKKAQTVLTRFKALFADDVRVKAWQDQIDQLANASTPAERKAKADTAYNLGLDSYRKDDFTSAKKFWQEALQIDPKYLQAQQNLDRLAQEHPELK